MNWPRVCAGGVNHAPVHSWTDTLRFAFQPVVNLTTGAVAGLEILARPETGDVLAEARRDPELDGRLAVSAVRVAVRRETLLPLFVNVYAGTLAALGGLPCLHDAVREAGRLPWEVTLDLCPPYTHVPHQALLKRWTCCAGRASGSAWTVSGTGMCLCDCSRTSRPAWSSWTRHF